MKLSQLALVVTVALAGCGEGRPAVGALRQHEDIDDCQRAADAGNAADPMTPYDSGWVDSCAQCKSECGTDVDCRSSCEQLDIADDTPEPEPGVEAPTPIPGCGDDAISQLLASRQDPALGGGPSFRFNSSCVDSSYYDDSNDPKQPYDPTFGGLDCAPSKSDRLDGGGDLACVPAAPFAKPAVTPVTAVAPLAVPQPQPQPRCPASPADDPTLAVTVRWELRQSGYNVAHTFGNGEHQGLGVYRQSMYWLPGRVGQPGGLCFVYTQTQRLFNHGRTVRSTQGARYFDVVDSWSYGRPLTSGQWYGAGDGTAAAETASGAYNCFRATATDGFCDSVCNNDGYVMPTSALGSNTACAPPRLPFTLRRHPAPIRCKWTTRWGWAAFAGRIKSGVIGHNSNTDATATKGMFAACVAIPWANLTDGRGNAQPSMYFLEQLGGAPHTICENVCGGQPTAAPACYSTTNLATAKVTWFNGCSGRRRGCNLGTRLQGDLPSGPQPTSGCAGAFGAGSDKDACNTVASGRDVCDAPQEIRGM